MGAITIESLLGGARVIRRKSSTTRELIEIVRRGLPAAAIDAIAHALDVTQSELSVALAIPERTLARRKKEGNLSTEESGKLVRAARVLQRATEVFEDAAAARDWLKARNRALGAVSPLSLLDTELGAEAVFDTLGRIEHGVFA